MLGRESGVRLRALRADYNSAALAAILGALAVVALLASAALVPVGPLIGLLIGSGRSTVAGIVLFTVITLVAFSAGARSPTGGLLAGSAAPICVAIGLGGPVAGGIVALIGSTERRELARGFPWYGLVGNHAIAVLAAVAGGLGANAIRAVCAPIDDQTLVSVLAVVASFGLFTVVNELGAGLQLALRQRRPLWPTLREFLRWQTSQLGSDVAMAVLMVAIYTSAAWWLTPVFVVPMLAVALGARRYQAAWEADHDPLTGTLLRRELGRRLSAVVADAPIAVRRAGLLMVDLDKFKSVNDTFGHEIGDRVLREVAARLGAGIRPGDSVARVGGDEFVILLPGIGDEPTLLARAEALTTAVAEPMSIDGQAFRIGLSIGGILVCGQSPDEVGLMAEADAAMYQAKRSGGGCRIGSSRTSADLVGALVGQ